MPPQEKDWTSLYLWTVALCLFLALLGLYVDVVGHMVVPRDGFWSPTHALVYGPLLAAVGATGLHLFWFQKHGGPGAEPGIFLVRSLPPPFLLMAAGLFLVPTGGLFDQWWHAALGERETLYSLPHMLAIAGAALGGVGMVVAVASRGEGEGGGLLGILVFGGLLVLTGLLLGPLDSVGSAQDYPWLVEHRPPTDDPRLNRFETSVALGLHRQNGLLLPLLSSAAFLPLLVLVRRFSTHPWAATASAAFYTAVRGGLFLFFSPAPDRWPFLPPPLPVLVPALFIDILHRDGKTSGPLLGAAAGGFFGVAAAAMGGAWNPPGLAGAVAAGVAAAWVSRPVASLLAGLTPRRAAALVLLLGLAAPVALGMFDWRVRGVL